MAQAALSFSTILEDSLSTLPADAAVLLPLYEAYRAAVDAMTATFNKPRTNEVAGGVLENDIVRLDSLACAVAVKLSHLSSVSKSWRDSYVETMVSHAFYIGDCAQLAMAQAVSLPVADHSTH